MAKVNAPALSVTARKAARRRACLFLLALIGPLLGLAGLLGHGLWSWAFPLYGFVLVPMADALLPARHGSYSEEEEAASLREPLFDWIVYSIVPIHWGLLVLFFFTINEPGLTSWEVAGRIATMGMLCGVYGINVAHELGHRAKSSERNMARALLLTSLYMHFIVEHNRGHHRHVGTPKDPATARRGETLYLFWFRTVPFSWLSAWNIETERLRKAGQGVWSYQNEMLRYSALQLLLCIAVWWAFGAFTLLAFLAAAGIGVLLLETVNYIEHYGLMRVARADGSYGRVQYAHSWNSDHPLGRIVLFELTRHSDHHHTASKKYQVLEGMAEGAQLPTGYPGMMLMSLVPSLWKAVVHPRLDRLRAQHPELA